MLRTGFEKKQHIYGLRLPKFSGILGKELQPGRRFGTELADYVKTRIGLKGILHSDELPNYGITEQELQIIRTALKCQPGDGFAMVLAEQVKSIKALEVVLERCKLALHEIPSETRGALEEGNTEYQRTLGGAARMYPDTDIKAIRIHEKQLQELKKHLPKWGSDRKETYTKVFGLSEQLAEKMKLSNHARFFEKLHKQGHDPKLTSVVLLENLTQLKRENIQIELISEKMLEELFNAVKAGELTRDSINPVLSEWTKNPFKKLPQILAGLNIQKADNSEVEQIIKGIVDKNLATVKEKGEQAIGALMGDAMRELRGKAPGQLVSELLKKEIKFSLEKKT
ncbi:MAG: GatB/YqeY domain-containing protein, partial [Candidatus Diapherotrites archaeon]|nr:GatB/YqeY domain-containing protein [Candidatus Diapherotrites archaeon]